jgi:hypothetical protein
MSEILHYSASGATLLLFYPEFEALAMPGIEDRISAGGNFCLISLPQCNVE